MDPKAMVKDAEKLAQALVKDAKQGGLSYAHLIQTLEITLRLLRSTYPGTPMDIFNLTQMAEATFLAVARPNSTKN